MTGSNLTRNILSLVAVVVIIYFAGRYMLRGTVEVGQPRVEMAGGELATSTNPADEFNSLLSRLAKVNFQEDSKYTIFNDPVFRAGLVNFSRDLPQIDQTRANPFAPLEGNPASYIRYTSPLPSSLVPTGSSTPIFPTSTPRATGTTEKTIKK